MPPLNFEANRDKLIAAFYQRLVDGERFKTISQARRFAGELISTPVVAGKPLAKAVEEAIEQAVVLTAKTIIEKGKEESALLTYDKLVDLYARQPTLGTRTSTSVEMQAFSTPVPLAFLAAKLADIDAETSVYEPSAGRGALLMLSAPANTYANELDPKRAEDLTAQGYQATQQDATWYQPPTAVDRVIANPPFGRRKKDGRAERFHIGCLDTPAVTSELDQAISWKALEAMKDDGKAVLIIGSEFGSETIRAQKYSSTRCQKFFFNLYRQYYVKEHFTVDGKLYSRQGAAFPVDVIVIEGRKLTPFLSPHTERKLPAAALPQLYSSYAELRSLFAEKGIENEQNRNSNFSNQSSSLGTVGNRSGNEPTRGTRTAADESNRSSRDLSESSEDEASGDGGGLRGDGRSTEPSMGSDDSQAALELYQRRNLAPLPRRHRYSSNHRGKSPPEHEDQSALSSASRDRSKQESRSDRDYRAQYDARSLADSSDPLTHFQEMPTPADSLGPRDENSQLGQVAYKARSKGQSLDSYVPQNLEVPIQTALDNLERAVGDVDQFVTDTLNFGSVENLHQALAAEQVDGVALAVHNLQQGKAALIGDDTGLGKGRQMAAAIKYSLETGNVPIFVTKDPGLYADMARDLADIGLDASQIRPFITDSKQTIPLPDGRTLETKPTSHKRELNQMMSTGELSSQYNMIFSTYSQLQTVNAKETDRRRFLDQIAPQSILVLDEAHLAGGSSNDVNKRVPDRAAFTRSLVRQAQGVFFASATATKRPDVMDLYAMRMSVADVTPVRGLQSTLERGGTPLQQISTAMLTLDGQYTRRARTYSGVEVSSQVVGTNHDDADQLSEIMRELLQFDKDKQVAVTALDGEAKARGKRMGLDSSTGMAGAQSTSFSSMIWLVTEQAALSRKADATADYAISVLEQGEKPFIGLGSTMGSFLEEYVKTEGLKPGDPIYASFQDVLSRYLERSREVLIKDYNGVQSREQLTDNELGEKAVAQYNKVEKLIDQADFSQMPTSPIDWIRYRVESAGYSFGELTGRAAYIEYDADGNATYQRKSNAETSKATKIEIIDGFNNGRIDVGLGNRSASTGYSMHASAKFQDQKRRHFIIAQPERDINVFKQFMGRFHRTGQVNAPKISLIVGNTPDETRPSAILARKLASLKANTTAARQNGIDFGDIPDYLNEIGDQVVSDMIRFDPDLSERLFDPITVSESSTKPVENAAAKVTGALPILPVADQEAFYVQLAAEYKATLERYEAMGENPLEANSVDLDARTIGNVDIVSRKEESTSVFAEGIRAEVVDVKVQSKPKSQLEVLHDVRKSVGLPIVRTSEEHDENEADTLAVAAVGSLYDKAVLASEKYKQSKQREYEATEPDRERRQSKLDKLEVASKKQLQRLTQIQRFRPGRTVRIVASNDRVFYGAITAVRKRGQSLDKLLSQDQLKENPTIPSRWEVVIAIADAQRQITLPLSKMNTNDKQADAFTVSIAQHSIADGDIYEMFDKRQRADREVRILMKGNLLRLGETAYADHGDLIVATMSNGKAEPVLLMNPEFNLEEQMQTTPVVLPDASAVRQFLQETKDTGIVKTLDNSIVLSRDSAETFIIQTGKRRKDIFLDEGLLAAAGSEFTSIGDRMECQFPNEQLKPVLDHLRQEKGQSVAAFSDHQLARDMLGIKLPEIRLADTVQETISREGLTPSVDMSNLEAIREQLAKNFEEPAVEETPEVSQPDERQADADSAIEEVQSRPSEGEKNTATASSETIEEQDGEAQQVGDGEEPKEDAAAPSQRIPDQIDTLTDSPTDLPAEVESALPAPEAAVRFQLQGAARHRLPCEKQVVRFLNESNIAPRLASEGDFHLRIENEPWMPLVVEAHDIGDHKNVYLTHYREQNGDLIHDGEMVFKLREDGHLSFEETAVQYFHGGEVRNYDKNFAEIFSANVLEQGFAEAAREKLAEAENNALSEAVEPQREEVEDATSPVTQSALSESDVPAVDEDAPVTIFELQPSEQHQLPCEQKAVRFLEETGIAPELTGSRDFRIEIKNKPWIPLVVEALEMNAHKEVTFTHYTIEDDGLSRHSELSFKLSPSGHLSLEETAEREPILRGEIIGKDEDFARSFTQQLLERGFVDAAKEQLAQQVLQPDVETETAAAVGEESPQTVEENIENAWEDFSDYSSEDLTFVDDLIAEHEGDEDTIIGAILEGGMQIPSELADTELEESVAGDDLNDEIEAQLASAEEDGDLLAQIDSEALLEDSDSDLSSPQIDRPSGAQPPTQKSSSASEGTEDAAPRPYAIVSDAYTAEPIEIPSGPQKTPDLQRDRLPDSPPSVREPGFASRHSEDSTSQPYAVISDAYTEKPIEIPSPLRKSPTKKIVASPSKAPTAAPGEAVASISELDPDKLERKAADTRHPQQHSRAPQQSSKPPVQSSSPAAGSLSAPKQTFFSSAAKFFRSALEAAAAPSAVEKRQHRKEATEKRTQRVEQPQSAVIEAQAYDAPTAVAPQPPEKIEAVETDGALNSSASGQPPKRSLADVVKQEVADDASGTVETVSIKDVEKAIKASIYLEDGDTFSKLEALQAKQPDKTEIEISPALKEKAIANRNAATKKFRHVLATDIVPMAQTLLHNAKAAGLTISRGNAVAFEGKNYTVKEKQVDQTKTIEVRCHRSKGYIRAVDGKIQRADNIVPKDREVFSKFASKTPLQLQQAVLKRQKAKSSGISH